MQEDQPRKIHTLTPAEVADFDAEAATAWIRAETDAAHSETLARMDEMAAAESEIVQRSHARAVELGLAPDIDELKALEAPGRAQSDFWTVPIGPEGAMAPEDTGLGVLRQPLPAVPAPHHKLIASRHKPYDSEAESQKAPGSDRAFADAGSGDIRLRAEQSFSGDWDWARGSLGAHFIIGEQADAMHVVFNFRVREDSHTGGGFFADCTTQVDRTIFFFNHTQNRRWISRQVIRQQRFSWGYLPPSLPRPIDGAALTGFGEADRGDRVTAVLDLYARVKSPLGWASKTLKGVVTSIDLLRT